NRRGDRQDHGQCVQHVRRPPSCLLRHRTGGGVKRRKGSKESLGGEEWTEDGQGLGGGFLGEEGPARNPPPADVGSPLAPDGDRVPPRLSRVIRPEDKGGTADTPRTPVGSVVLDIYRCPRAVVFARRMNYVWITEGAQVLGERAPVEDTPTAGPAV